MSTWWSILVVGGLAAAGAGAVVVLLALFRDRSRGRRRCPRCWYDLGTRDKPTVAGTLCPECGRDARAERRLYRTRRRWRLAAAGVLVLACGLAGAGTPRVLHDGWFSLVPAPVLNGVLSLWEARAEECYERASALRGGSAKTVMTSFERLLAAHYGGNLLRARLEGRPHPKFVPTATSGVVLPQVDIPAAIASLDREARPAVPALIEGLRSKDPWFPRQCAGALSRLRQSTPGLTGRLLEIARKDENAQTRAMALKSLSLSGAMLVTVLPNGGFSVLPTPATPVSDARIVAAARHLAMNDPSMDVRAAALAVLAERAAAPRSHLDIFREAIHWEHPEAQRISLSVLAMSFPLPSELIWEVVELAAQELVPHHESVAEIALYLRDERGERSPAALVRLLDSPGDLTRYYALNFLTQVFKEDPRTADAVLRTALVDPSEQNMVYALQLLRSRTIRHERCLEAAHAAARHESSRVRLHAYQVLSELEPDREGLCRLLEEALCTERDQLAVITAIECAAAAGCDSAEMLRALKPHLDSRDAVVRQAALDALETLSPEPR